MDYSIYKKPILGISLVSKYYVDMLIGFKIKFLIRECAQITQLMSRVYSIQPQRLGSLDFFHEP
jgi:hypothetical protein